MSARVSADGAKAPGRGGGAAPPGAILLAKPHDAIRSNFIKKAAARGIQALRFSATLRS